MLLTSVASGLKTSRIKKKPNVAYAVSRVGAALDPVAAGKPLTQKKIQM